MRESWRIFVSLTLAPLLHLVQAQLRDALDEPILVLDANRCKSGGPGYTRSRLSVAPRWRHGRLTSKGDSRIVKTRSKPR